MTVMRRLSRVPSSCVSSIMGREPSYGFDTDEQMNGKKFPGKCQVVLLLIKTKFCQSFSYSTNPSADLTGGWCRDSFEQSLALRMSLSSPGKRASRNLTRSVLGLRLTLPGRPTRATMGGKMRFGRGLGERENERKETGTRRRGKNRH